MRYGSAKRDAGILRPPVKDSYVVEATIWDTRDGDGVYGGTKAFVLSFLQSLHHEFADKGVRVQVVLPGATEADAVSVPCPLRGALPDAAGQGMTSQNEARGGAAFLIACGV